VGIRRAPAARFVPSRYTLPGRRGQALHESPAHSYTFQVQDYFFNTVSMTVNITVPPLAGSPPMPPDGRRAGILAARRDRRKKARRGRFPDFLPASGVAVQVVR
jgi:hypothetical protein